MSGLGISLDSLPDHVRDLQLAVRFESHDQQDLTIHPPSSHRHPTLEIWTSKRDLGQGARSEVILQELVTTQPVPKLRVVKSIRVPDEPDQSTAQLYQVELASKFSQPEYLNQFATCIGWYTGVGTVHIATEYCELGDLERYLPKLGGRLFDTDIYDVTWQILSALRSMHEENFSHGDLNLSNVLVMTTHPTWWVKLADFGMSTPNGIPLDANAARGALHEMAPELLGYSGNPSTADPYLADMWSLGQIAYRISAGFPMFASQQSLFKYCDSHLPLRDSVLRKYGVEEDFIQFIKALAEHRPGMRLSMNGALRYQWARAYQDYPPEPEPEPERMLTQQNTPTSPSFSPVLAGEYFIPNEPAYYGPAEDKNAAFNVRSDSLAVRPIQTSLMPPSPSDTFMAGYDHPKSPNSFTSNPRSHDEEHEEEPNRTGKRNWKYFAKFASNLTQSTASSESGSEGHSLHAGQQSKRHAIQPLSPPKPPSRVPSGWVTQLDDQSQQWFFVNRFTNMAQWEVPTSPAKAPKMKESPRPDTPSSSKKSTKKRSKPPNAAIARFEENYPGWAI